MHTELASQAFTINHTSKYKHKQPEGPVVTSAHMNRQVTSCKYPSRAKPRCGWRMLPLGKDNPGLRTPNYSSSDAVQFLSVSEVKR